MRRAQLPARLQPVMWGVAMVCFASMTVYLLYRLSTDSEIRLGGLVAIGLAACIGLATIVTNAFEIKMLLKFHSQQHLPLREFTKVSIVGSASNYLPVPGALIAKSVWLKRKGVNSKLIVATQVLASLSWLGLSFLLAVLARSGIEIFLLFLAITLILFFLSLRYLRNDLNVSNSSQLISVQIVLVFLNSLKLYAIFSLIGSPISLYTVFILQFAGVATLLINFTPAGLGVREALYLLAGGVVSLEAEPILIASSIERVSSLLALTIGFVFIRPKISEFKPNFSTGE